MLTVFQTIFHVNVSKVYEGKIYNISTFIFKTLIKMLSDKTMTFILYKGNI